MFFIRVRSRWERLSGAPFDFFSRGQNSPCSFWVRFACDALLPLAPSQTTTVQTIFQGIRFQTAGGGAARRSRRAWGDSTQAANAGQTRGRRLGRWEPIDGSASAEIEAPIAAVYAVAADVEGSPRWQPEIKVAECVERDGDGKQVLVHMETDAKVRTPGLDDALQLRASRP